MFRTFILLAITMFFICSQAAVIQERSSTHEGIATYYSVNKSGKPSCGGKVDNDDMVVALSHKLMQGHGGPCGEKIKVHGKHGSITVKVVDTCAGCGKNDIDLSPKAFEKLGKMKEGELEIEWSFK